VRYDSCHPNTTFLKPVEGQSGVNQWRTPCAYREDTDKKDQGRAFLDVGSALPEPDEDGPTIRTVGTLATDDDGETYKTPSKLLSPSPLAQHSSPTSQEIPV
jgi:hypothetical protein